MITRLIVNTRWKIASHHGWLQWLDHHHLLLHVLLVQLQPLLNVNKRAESPPITRLGITCRTVAEFPVVRNKNLNVIFLLRAPLWCHPIASWPVMLIVMNLKIMLRLLYDGETNESECSFQPVVGTIVPERFEEQTVLVMSVLWSRFGPRLVYRALHSTSNGIKSSL